MNTKQEIIYETIRIDDPDILLEIDRWISSILNSSVSEEFSKEEMDAVHKGYKQYRSGATINQHEAKKLFIEWQKGRTGKQHESAKVGYPEGFKELYGSVKDESLTAPVR